MLGDADAFANGWTPEDIGTADDPAGSPATAPATCSRSTRRTTPACAALVRRLPDLRLAADDEVEWAIHRAIHGPVELPVTW